jgi:hypothetical protein
MDPQTSTNVSALVRRIIAANLAPRVIAAIGALLVLPSLAGGLAMDDYVHRFAVHGNPLLTEVSTLDVFRFADGDPAHGRVLLERGVFPWPSRLDARVAFLRPLASLSHWIDYRGLDVPPWVMHAENVAWYALLVFLAAVLLRRLVAAPGVAGLAGLLYAIDPGHALPAGWIANRNALIAAAAGLAAILAHDRWRREGWRPGALVGPVLFALALAGGESGTGALALVAAHALTLDPGSPRARSAAVLSYAGIAILWQIVYRAYGYGAVGSAFYVDLAHAPGTFLVALVTRAPLLVAGELTLFPVEISVALSRAALWGLAAVAVLVCAAFAYAIAPILRRDASARFLALGGILSLAAPCGTYPSTRLLLFASVSVCGLLALLLADAARGIERRAAARGAAFVGRLAHLVVAPCLLPLLALAPLAIARFVERSGPDLPEPHELAGVTTVVVRAPNFLVAGYRFGVPHGEDRTLPGGLRILTSTAEEAEIRRVDPFTLEVRGPALAGDASSRLYRDTPMRAGEVVELHDMRATVLEIDDDGEPRAVSFRFATPLDDPSRIWVAWMGGRFVRFAVPDTGSVVALR